MVKTIAVDGTAGSGKSTICKLISKRKNFTFISTGGFYRSYALILKKNNLIKASVSEQITELKKHEIKIINDDFYIDGVNVQNELKSEEISILSSNIAKVLEIRDYANKQQISFLENFEKVIMDGRDIATKIMPNADLKFYFFSSAISRAKRRAKELNSKNFFQIFFKILKRDFNDKYRKASPLIIDKEAIKINTSKKTIEQVYSIINKIIEDDNKC